MIKEILLAEDERGTALLVRTRLERYGYNVHVAANGIEALGILASREIDLLITDVVMPEMDGVDLYLAVRKNPRTADLPIIIVTDKKMFKDSFSALGAGHFVPKSSSVEELVAKIRDVEGKAVVAKDYRKVLIAGEDDLVLEEMRKLLFAKGWLVTTASGPSDILAKVFLMSPHVVILDLLMKGPVTTKEMVKSLKCYDFLKRTSILVYASFAPEQLGEGQKTLEEYNEEIKGCFEAGDQACIGRFNRVTFLDRLKECGLPM